MSAERRASRTDSTPHEQIPQERRIEVARTARFYQLGRVSPSTRQLWFGCHGYRQLAGRFVHCFAGLELEALGVVVVVPEGLSRFYIDPVPGRHGPETRVGASWMTRADREHEIRDYVRYLDRLAEHVAGTAEVRPKTVVLGFSQGAHTAARWAALGRTRVDELVLWGAYAPDDTDLAPVLSRTGLTLVFGDQDPTAEPALAQAQTERLANAGIEPRRVSYRGGHRVDRKVVRSLAESFGR